LDPTFGPDNDVPETLPLIGARPPGTRLGPVQLALAGAAAAIALGAFAWALNPGPQWRVADLQDAHGNVMVDDEPIPADDAESLNEALVPGATIEWNGNGDLELVSRGQAALGIAPGTTMTLPAPPPRWFARASNGRVTMGTVRLTTGSRFRGARLTIATPEATVFVTGTTLAVIEEPMGTCVCVLEGKVHVMAGANDMGMVPAGQRQTVFADGSKPVRAEMRPVERGMLGEMRRAMGPVLEKPRRD
jgi:ferric-dicitrate binding protein FerR (iron transport regulator)